MTTKRSVWAIAVVVALIGCKRNASDVAVKPTTSPAIETLIAAVPGNAMAIGFIDMAEPPWTYVTGGVVPLDEATRKTLDKELREYVDRYLGVDLSKLQYVVGFVSGPPARGALLVKTIGGTLKMPGATEYAGGKVWGVDPDAGVSVAIKGDVLVFGKDEAVRDVLDTLAGKRKNVTVENKPLVDWLHGESADAAVAFAAIAPKGLPLPQELAGLQRVAVSIGKQGVRAVVDGEPAAISSLQAMIDQAIDKALAEVQRAHDAAVAGNVPPPEGAFAIIGAAYAKSWTAKLKPRRDGNRLSASLDFAVGSTQAMMVVAGIGILAAIAVPAFMDYMKKSKITEASLQLNKIAKYLKLYYVTNGTLPKGNAPLTPAQACCAGPEHKCVSRPEDWQNPIWTALELEIDEPNLFQYRYHSDGKTAVVEAIGDLDCDTNMITYRLDVTTANGNPATTLTEPPPNTD